MAILPVKITFERPTIRVTDPAPVVFPLTVDLSKTYTPQKHLVYNYYNNADATSPLPLNDYMAIKARGIYQQ